MDDLKGTYFIQHAAFLDNLPPPRMLLRRHISGTDDLDMRVHQEQSQDLTMTWFCWIFKLE